MTPQEIDQSIKRRWYGKTMDPSKLPPLPEEIKQLVIERTNLELGLQAVLQTNVYGQKVDDLIQLSSRQLQIQRRLAEINEAIVRWVEFGSGKDGS